MGPGWHGTGCRPCLGRTLGPQAGTARPASRQAGRRPKNPPGLLGSSPAGSPYNRDPPLPRPAPNPNPIRLASQPQSAGPAALDTLTLIPFASQPQPHSTPARSIFASSRRSIFVAGATVVLGSGDIAAAPSPLRLSLSSLLPQSIFVFLFTPSPLFVDEHVSPPPRLSSAIARRPS